MKKAIAPALALALGIAVAPVVNAATITVNSTADTTGGVPCTLRDAIVAANTNAAAGGCGAGSGADVIAFAIPVATDPGCNAGTGVCVIKPATELPFFTSVVDVNGYTQPGASANTLAPAAFPNATGLDSQIRIELDGSLTSGATGLVLNASSSGSRIRGLSIHSFHTGINVNTASNLIDGNYIGVKADGMTGGALTFGLGFQGASNTVGGAAAASRNLIGSAGGAGVFVNGANSTTILGNLIGTNRLGTAAAANGTGIQARGTSGPAFGTAIQNNVISGNGFAVQLQATSNTGITGNTIGVAVGGAALGNAAGIAVTDSTDGASTMTILSGNAIANSTSFDGVLVSDFAGFPGFPGGVYVDGSNAIWNNARLGINLVAPGDAAGVATPNDALDADVGPNGLQNFPVITSAVKNANGSISISFTLDSLPSTTFGINAWANADCSVTSAREGRFPSGQISPNVMTDAAGHVAGVFTIPNPPPAGWVVGAGISMTARDTGAAAVSEFSACALVTNAVPVELQFFDAE